MAKAEITRWNGSPQLVIDGKPYPPMGYFIKWKDPENHLEHIRQRGHQRGEDRCGEKALRSLEKTPQQRRFT